MQEKKQEIGLSAANYSVPPADESDAILLQQAAHYPGKEREIDVMELAGRLWKKRKLIFKLAGISVMVGLIVAFSIPKEYTTTVKLAPEAADGTRKMGNLGGLAAIAGIDLNTSVASDALSPGLFPDVVQSSPFLLDLFPVNVGASATDSLSFYVYMTSFQKKAWWSEGINFPFKMLSWIKTLFSEEKDPPAEINPFHLTLQQEQVLQEVRKRISVAVDKKTYIITVAVKMQDAAVSARLTEVVLEKLQDYITDYRTRKAKKDLTFSRKVFLESREAYYKAQRAYAAFEDGNRNITSSLYRTEQERLRNEMTLTFNVYTTLAQKLEQDKIRVQEQTPVYTVIEPATVPLRASSPNKLFILIGFIMAGLAGAAGYVLLPRF